MRKIYAKNIKGWLYVDELGDEISLDTDKIRIYDSQFDYLTYFEREWFIRNAETAAISPEIFFDRWCKEIEHAKDMEDLLENKLRFDTEGGSAKSTYLAEPVENVKYLCEALVEYDKETKAAAVRRNYPNWTDWFMYTDFVQNFSPYGANHIGDWIIVLLEDI